MLHFDTVSDSRSASKIVADRLQKELEGHKKVLWLLSGGSNIEIETVAFSLLPPELTANLTIMLNDERFGPYGHNDSNMQQLRDAGFPTDSANVVPVLVPESLPLETTTRHYEDNIMGAFSTADVIISELGMGTDGHIAGILPNTPAINAAGLVTNYTTEQFVRITVTFAALKRVHTAYLFAFGSDKLGQLERLQHEDIPLNEQPAQILKQIPEVYVYNDQKTDALGDIKGGNE